jgi:hypothetical protein
LAVTFLIGFIAVMAVVALSVGYLMDDRDEPWW